jgi:integrase/recombinase XerC/integrase/recombinase XerD
MNIALSQAPEPSVNLPEVVHSSEITQTNTKTIEELVESFISSLDVKQNSKALYRRTLKQYFCWIAKKGYLLSEIARPQIVEYREELLALGFSTLTVGSYITSLKKFYEWAEANKYYPNVAKGVKLPKRKQEFRKLPLYPDQAAGLLNYYQDKALRDFAIVNLLLRGGLRCIEVIRANVGDITYKKTDSGAPVRVLLVHGKGRDEKDQFIVLTDKAYKPIEEYLATRGKIRPIEPLFTSESNNSANRRLTTRTVSLIAKEGLKAIGLNSKEYTAHSLRHTAIVSCRRAGGSLEQAQSLARHLSPTTTQIYDRLFRDEQRLQNSGEALIDTLY